MSGLSYELVRRCASCRQLVRHIFMFPYREIRWGTWLWTDGKWVASMLVASYRLLSCPHCQALLWIEDAELVGTLGEEGGKPMEGVSAPYLQVPSYRQYQSLLDQVAGSREKELYLRIRMWWLDNDRRRRATSKAPGLGARETTEITELAGLLDEQIGYERVLKAEAMRELGLFADAEGLLDAPVHREYIRWAEAIRELAASGDTRVRAVR